MRAVHDAYCLAHTEDVVVKAPEPSQVNQMLNFVPSQEWGVVKDGMLAFVRRDAVTIVDARPMRARRDAERDGFVLIPYRTDVQPECSG